MQNEKSHGHTMYYKASCLRQGREIKLTIFALNSVRVQCSYQTATLMHFFGKCCTIIFLWGPKGANKEKNYYKTYVYIRTSP